MVLRGNRRAQERRAIGREMVLLSECHCVTWEKCLKLTAGISWSQDWSPLLSLASWLFLFALGEAEFVNWLFRENKFSNLAFPVWFTRWQFPCHWTWSLDLKYSQHVNALQAVTVAMTSLPSSLLFWSQGGEQPEAQWRVEGRYSCQLP